MPWSASAVATLADYAGLPAADVARALEREWHTALDAATARYARASRQLLRYARLSSGGAAAT